MTFGQKLKYYRLKQKMRQESLAELSHVSVSSIRKYEMDERTPRKEHIESFALSLNICPAALMDYSIEKSYDAFLWLYSIGNWANIEFVGEKDNDGNYIKDTISIRFANTDLMDFVKEWADKKKEIENISEAISLIKDKKLIMQLNDRISELSDNLNESLVFDTISKEIFNRAKISNYHISKRISENTPKLNTYSDLLRLIIQFERNNSVKMECVSIYERVWLPRAIITFEADSLDLDNPNSEIRNLYEEFLYYFRSFSDFNITIDGFSFNLGKKEYYRFIIEDKKLALSLNSLKSTLKIYNNGKDIDDKEANEIIERYNIKIASG